MDSDVWNVGRADEAVRVALAVLVLAGGAFALARMDPSWVLAIVLGAFLAVGYLLLTSVAHVDPLYAATGLDTRHPRQRD